MNSALFLAASLTALMVIGTHGQGQPAGGRGVPPDGAPVAGRDGGRGAVGPAMTTPKALIPNASRLNQR